MKRLTSLLVCFILVMVSFVILCACNTSNYDDDDEDYTKKKTTQTETEKISEDTNESFDTEKDSDEDTSASVEGTGSAESSEQSSYESGTHSEIRTEIDSDKEYKFEVVQVCTHQYSRWWAETEATCTSAGSYYRICNSCKKTQTKEFPATGHRFSAWELGDTPINEYAYPCTRTCLNCSFVEESQMSKSDSGIATSFGGGTGTQNDPYKISTASQLAFLADAVNSGKEGYNTAHYVLTNNISLVEYDWTPIGVYSYNGTQSNSWQFCGSFNGNGYSISGFTKSKNDTQYEYFGLFGYLGQGAVIENLGIDLMSLYVIASSDDYSYIGGIAGYAKEVTVRNCNVKGYIILEGGKEEAYVGGLLGKADKTTVICSGANVETKAEVSNFTGYDVYIGGFAGEISKSNVSDCYAMGEIKVTVSGNAYVGGFASRILNNDVTVDRCLADVRVVVEGNREHSEIMVGGFVGEITTSRIAINDCGATDDVFADAYSVKAGAFIGSARATEDMGITNCYATGAVGGNAISYACVGGFIGEARKVEILSCYATGSLSFSCLSKDGYSNVGGFAGELSGETASLKNVYATGDVVVDNQYYISTAGGLVGYVKYATIDGSYAKGDLIITHGYAGGLVGEIKDGKISNSYATGDILSRGTESGASIYGGGLVGNLDGGEISSSYATGNICSTGNGASMSVNAGGLVARGTDNAVIKNCYARGKAYATVGGEGTNAYVGALIGEGRNVTVTNCYATGDAIGYTFMGADYAYVGGFIGYARNTNVVGCFAIGNVKVQTDKENCALCSRFIATAVGECNIESSYCYERSVVVSNKEFVQGEGDYTKVSGDIIYSIEFYNNYLKFDKDVWDLEGLNFVYVDSCLPKLKK